MRYHLIAFARTGIANWVETIVKVLVRTLLDCSALTLSLLASVPHCAGVSITFPFFTRDEVMHTSTAWLAIIDRAFVLVITGLVCASDALTLFIALIVQGTSIVVVAGFTEERVVIACAVCEERVLRAGILVVAALDISGNNSVCRRCFGTVAVGTTARADERQNKKAESSSC